MEYRSQVEKPQIELVEQQDGEVTLCINSSQAMQGWEQDMMRESAELLCGYGSEFLEVGLGLGFSALHIANHPNTRRHVVVEKYREVIDLFHQRHPDPPVNLEIVEADFFYYVLELKEESLDGIFFDPALPMELWDHQPLWEAIMPLIVTALRRGGVFIPFFSTEPILRKQYVPFFDKVVVYRQPFQAYLTTEYTYGTSGDAYIQCFVKS